MNIQGLPPADILRSYAGLKAAAASGNAVAAEQLPALQASLAAAGVNINQFDAESDDGRAAMLQGAFGGVAAQQSFLATVGATDTRGLWGAGDAAPVGGDLSPRQQAALNKLLQGNLTPDEEEAAARTLEA